MNVTGYLRFWAMILAIGMVIILVIFQLPDRLLSPTLFLNEGFYYYKFSYEHGWVEALIKPHMGYYNFLTNAVSVIAAKLVPMEAAPTVFRGAVIMMWWLIGICIFLSGSPFETPLLKGLALAATLLVVPSVGMFSLTGNLTHSNFYSCVLAGLIMISDAKSRPELWLHRIVLLLAVFTGPVTSFLLPVYAFCYWQDRTRERLLQVSILAIGLLVQASAVYYSNTHADFYAVYEDPGFSLINTHKGSRFYGFAQLDVWVFWLFNRAIVHPLAGWGAIFHTGIFFEYLISRKNTLYYISFIVCNSAVVFWAVMISGFGDSAGRSRHPLRLMLAIFTVSLFSFLGGTTGGAWPKTSFLYACDRYFVPQGIFMVWAFIINMNASPDVLTRRIYSLLIAWMLLTGTVIWYDKYNQPPDSHRPKSWSDEVALWKADHNHRITIMSPVKMSPVGMRLGNPVY